MKLFLIILTVFASLLCFGQQPNLNTPVDMVDQVSNMENLIRALSFQTSMEPKAENVEGTAYLHDEFENGDVLLATGVKYTGIPLRYNVYNDQIEFRNQAGKVYNINNPEGIRELIIGDSRFIYVGCLRNKKMQGAFVEVISEGHISLLKHHRIKIQPAKPAQTHQEAQAPKFVKIPSEYLIRKADGVGQYFKNEKELLALLSDKKSEISKLISRENLSVNQEKDLIRIINFYNGK